MFKIKRVVVLGAILVGALIFLPPFNGVGAYVKDLLDSRPERTALFIGNSRTFYHDMPFMVRSIADSAGYPEKLHIEMDAEPGVSLADHMSSSKTQALLGRRWDHVVLQVLSSEQYSAEHSGGTWDVAANLIREVQANGARPSMFVTWRYTDKCTNHAGMPTTADWILPSGYPQMHRNIQDQHARLAALTGVDLVNVGIIWEALQSRPQDFSLYDDCNHPSIYGSYLSALMFYSYFSGRDVSAVTFRPSGISPDDARMLRDVVSEYQRQKTSG